MPGAAEIRVSRLFVILNPAAGSFAAGAVQTALARHFSCTDGSCDVHEAAGRDNLAELARAAVTRGCDVVVAAGGDGTISAVADGLVGSSVPLGVVPLGTANVLARELGVPVDIEAACALLAGPITTTGIDAMEVRGRHFYTQVGIGIDAFMIRDTTRTHKKRFGRVAYLWTAAIRLAGFQRHRFTVCVDGRTLRLRASQVLLANSGTLGQPPLRWGQDIRPDDGRIDVCIVRAKTVLDYLGLAWHILVGQHRLNRNVRYFLAERSVVVTTRHPLPVQADGEIIGETPVDVHVVPGAVRVVVPATRDP